MSYFDMVTKQTLSEILKQEWEVDNRAVWKDGSPIMTKRIFGVVNRYNLAKEFPVPTLRPLPLKTIFEEIDWIYIKQSNNVNDLNSTIWDAWADETGSIGAAYGAQVAKPVFGYENQMDYILGEIQKNPTSRRLVIELWNVNELDEMNLPPCAHHLQFVVKNGKVNLILKQRSQDFLVANAFNVCEYSIFVHMVARHCCLEVGELIHIIGDCHIYNKHIEQAEELMSREPYPVTPTLWINPEKTDFYSFTADDFKLKNYFRHLQLKFDVAV
ncbi:thymidylate synthase [Priestia sp. YIM B13551]|uniref:thymidylate synthase n=1 Tax=Priestia sp. YIM B13551 TaxID=3366306 RepID=UPI0036734CE0